MKGKIYITGADGFIGSHLVEKAYNSGLEVIAHCRNQPRRIPPYLQDKCKIVIGDIRSRECLKNIADCDAVYHLAAMSFVPRSIEDPFTALDVNFKGTFNLLDAIRGSNTRIIFASTSHVYGIPQYLPIDEKHPLEPTTPYGASKLAADRLVRAFGECYGIPYVILRLFNIYGPRQDAHFIIPTIIRQCLDERRVVLGNGLAVRDFLHVDDLTNLLILCLHSENAKNNTFNVGSGYTISIQALAKKIMKIAGIDGEPIFDISRARKNDIEQLTVNFDKIKNTLPWKPKISLHDGLNATFQAYARENSNLWVRAK
ncbi:MAG: GDP-mannose 4,6-dehydratase [Thermoplasmata archaeon]